MSLRPRTAIVNGAEPPRGDRATGGPDRSFTILKERINILSGKVRVVSQLAILPTGESDTCANPKTPIAGGEQASDIVTGELLTGWRLPWDAPNAIEANQAEFRAEQR